MRYSNIDCNHVLRTFYHIRLLFVLKNNELCMRAKVEKRIILYFVFSTMRIDYVIAVEQTIHASD